MMKRICMLCLILLCLGGFSFAQSANLTSKKKMTLVVKKKTVDSTLSKAKTVWTAFWNVFSKAIKKQDHKLLKEMLLPNVRHHDCCEDSNRDGDLRIEFLKSLDENEESGWEALNSIILKGKLSKLEECKDYENEKLRVCRSINLGDTDGSMPWTRFVFVGGKWYLETLAYYEV